MIFGRISTYRTLNPIKRGLSDKTGFFMGKTGFLKTLVL